MMRFFRLGISVVAGLLMLVACNQETQEKAFVFVPEDVIAGQPATISYNSDSTNLAGREDIKAVVYFWQNYHWIAQDLPIQKKSGLWKGKFDVPENAALVAVKLFAGDTIDMGGKSQPYVTFTKDTSNQTLPSAYVGWGLLRAKTFEEYSIPGYVPDSAKIENKVMRFWCNQETGYHPDEAKHVAYYGAQAVAQSDKPNRLVIIENNVKYILALDSINEVSEIDLMHALESTQHYLHNDSLENVLKDRMLDKYPDGLLARDNEIYRIFRTADFEEQKKAMEKFVKRFPFEKFKDTPTETSELYLAKDFQSVIYNEIIKHNDYGALKKYIHEVPSICLEAFYWNIVQIPHTREMLKAEQLRPHANLLINEVMNRPRTIKQMAYSPLEWETKFYETWKSGLLVYAKILDETGDTKEAFNWMQKIAPYYQSQSADFSDFYIATLRKTGHENEIIPVIKAGIRQNAATPEMIELLKKAYIKENGSEEGFDSYFNSLKSENEKLAMEQELKKSLINEPIQLFELEKLNGGTVDMAKLKGKIIVLDLWATWCTPCKAAMPGMQMVVNKYQKDDNVKFYFVATMEQSPNYKEGIREFIAKNNYNFTVLLDAENPGTHKPDYIYSTYTKAFHFSGIPQKMIIDGNGRLRWMSVGFNGSPSELVDEISYIIELLKEEK